MTDLEIAMLITVGKLGALLSAEQPSIIAQTLQTLEATGYVQSVTRGYNLTYKGLQYLNTTPEKSLTLSELRAQIILIEGDIRVLFRNIYALGLDITDRMER